MELNCKSKHFGIIKWKNLVAGVNLQPGKILELLRGKIALPGS
jgi:hypothetical protein